MKKIVLGCFILLIVGEIIYNSILDKTLEQTKVDRWNYSDKSIKNFYLEKVDTNGNVTFTLQTIEKSK